MSDTTQSRRFVFMFQTRFSELVSNGIKKQSIRPTRKRVPTKGDIIECRERLGMPYRSKQRNLRRGIISETMWVCVSVQGLGISLPFVGAPKWKLPENQLDMFAQLEGFENWRELITWFERTHGLPFEGILVKWEVAR